MAMRRSDTRNGYVLEQDRVSDRPTVFIIRKLTDEEVEELVDLYPMAIFARLKALLEKHARVPGSVTDEELSGLQTQITRSHKAVCKRGIESVRNALDAGGQVVELPAPEIIDAMSDHTHIRELAQAVLAHNRLLLDTENAQQLTHDLTLH